MTDRPIHGNASGPSHADVDRLFIQWQQHGDPNARQQLVERYLPLAYKLARRYYGAREPIDDLRQVAAIGLLKPIDGYDITRATGFVPYAVPSILASCAATSVIAVGQCTCPVEFKSSP
jgi:DNA-directed RNA polymerase specialized sigma subunit